MRLSAAVFLIGTCLSSYAQEGPPSIIVAGLTIQRGMPEEAIRFELVYPYGIVCEKDIGDGEPRYCRITSEEQDNVGEVFFKDGRVVSASRFVEVATGEYGGLRTLYELLAELTDGAKTCAIVSSGAQQLMIAFPEKKVSLSLHRREGEGYFLAIRESLRWNPTPQLELQDCWPGYPEQPAQAEGTD